MRRPTQYFRQDTSRRRVLTITDARQKGFVRPTGAGRPSFEQAHGLEAESFRREASKVVLSRQANTSLWQQLADQLENMILSNKLAVNSRIPSEPALCEIFDVSRPVVRSAIASLASRGLINKIPRKGMFIGDPPKESGFVTANISVFDDMHSRGAKIDTKTYEVIRVDADEDEIAGLKLSEGEQVVRLKRVFWVDGSPITYTRMSFPAKKVPGFERENIEGRSILGMIRDLYGRSVIRAERSFAATLPSEEAQERMQVSEHDPLIWIESVGFEADGSPLEYYRAFYDSRAARIKVTVSD